MSFRTFSSSGGGGGGGRSGGGGGGFGFGGSSGSGGLWAFYLALLSRNPLATKAVTAAVLNAVGDVVAQLAFGDDGASFDVHRLAVFTFLGFALIGPALHFWYGFLSRAVPAVSTPGALGRLALDQLAFAPVFLSAVITSVMALEGHAGEAPAKLRADLPAILRSNWALWVPFQFLNFRFVPVHLQVLASNVVALAWNTYMSYASHNAA